MPSNTGSRATVLVVDDEQAVADVQAVKLADEYETHVAYSGRDALATLEELEEDVDAVLLDRRMPDVHGDDVLGEIRERGIDCVVIMTTAVDPDLNILEMDFDDYLIKPIETETLLSALDQHLDTRNAKDPRLEEFFSVVSTLEVLEAELPPEELAASEEYADLKRRAVELGNELDDSHPDFDEIVNTYRDVRRESS